MSYADLINHSPKTIRTSQDRFSISSSSSPKSLKFSPKGPRTPESKVLKTNSSLSSLSSRNLTPTVLFSSNSCQFSSDSSSPRRHRSSANLSLSSSSSLTNTLNQRIYPQKPIIKIPIDVDIPTDFYISPIDWSKKDVIITVLSDSIIHFYKPKLQSVEKMEYKSDSEPISIKINNFSDGQKAAFGLENGQLQLFDISTQKVEETYDILNSPIIVSNWSDTNLIISGNKEGLFSLLDPQSGSNEIYDSFFSEEICGIQFNPTNSNIFAISSNDSTVKLFDLRNLTDYLLKYSEHKSAVKALTFSPNNENVIVTGGGTLDKTIRMWDTITGETKYVIDTNSQVCNLYWNKEFNEIVSSHGFSQNQIALWRGSNLTLITQYFENYNRVLYMTHSDDHTKIATLIPSEGINIWKFFPSMKPSLSKTILDFK